MLVYNTTYHAEESVAENFLIWLNEAYIPEMERGGLLRNPRLLKILSHQEEGNISFSLQWEVESSAVLHRWHLETGIKLNEQMLAVFKDKVIGIPTLMEVIR